MTLSHRFLLRCAAACAVALGTLLVLAYHSPLARWTDAHALGDFSQLEARPLLGSLGEQLVRLADPKGLLALTGVVLLMAALARRPRHALGALVLIGAANLTTQVLKPLLAEERSAAVLGGGDLSPEGFPSGHATAAMSVALAAVIVAPRAWRLLAAAGGASLVLAVSFSLLGLAWHFPSDVIGGYLVASGWCFVVLAGLQFAGERWPERSGRLAARLGLERHGVEQGGTQGFAMVLAVGAVVAVLAALLVASLPRLDQYAHAHTAAAGVAAVITVSALALVAAVTAAAATRH